MITKFKNFIKEDIDYLSYDDFDLDFFTNRNLVGRWFDSPEKAKEYLTKVLNSGENKDNKTINDFIIGISTLYKGKENTNSTHIWQIYPKPTTEEIDRNLASKFIQKYGIISSPDLRYITHPLYAYVEYKHIQKLKDLGVQYQFKPLKEIPLESVLERCIKEKIGGSVNIFNDGTEVKIRFYNLYDKTMDELKEFKIRLDEIIKDFNNKIGTDFYISKINPIKSKKDNIKDLLNDLDDKKYKPENNFRDYKYKDCFFTLKRGEDEDEYLAVVSMESLSKPKMIKKK